MHLVFLNQYYPPDAAPTGVMLAAVVEELAAQGHEVTVICAEGGYAGTRRKTSRRKTQDEEGRDGLTHPSHLSPSARGDKDTETETKIEDVVAVGDRRSESEGGDQCEDPRSTIHDPQSTIRVLRIRATRFGRGTFLGKVVDYLSYYVGVAWKLMWLRPRPERIVALTTPPYLSVLARVFSKLRGGDHAHWVMDLYPDVMVAHGMLREGSLPQRLLAGMARWGFGGRRCAALLTLGPDMAERVGELLSVVGCRLSADKGKSDPAVAGPASRDEVGRPRPSAPDWIPLWEGDHRTSNVEHRTSNIERGTSKDESEDHPPSTIHDPRSLRHARGWREDELVVMYSGNMGLGHRFGEILEVIGKETGGRNQETGVGNVAAVCDRRSESDIGGQMVGNVAAVCDRRSEGEVEVLKVQSLKAVNESEAEHPPSAIPDPPSAILDPPSTIHDPQSPTRFVFFGGGKRRGEIERFVAEHPDLAVELHDYAPAEELGIHLRSADVHLASLAAEWTGTMVPSKLQGIFHAARPVIFIGDASSSIGRWVAESGGGWVVAAGDVAGLERAIDEARDPEVRESRGRAAKAFAEVNFDKPTNVRRVAEVLAGQGRFSG